MRTGSKDKDRLSVDFSYAAMTIDRNPVAAGQLVAGRKPGDSHAWVTMEDSNVVSDRVAVRDDGAFAVRVQLRENILNAFTLNVERDGVPVPVANGQFVIVHGTTVAKPVLSQSVGIVLADNTVRWYLRKGCVLPARETVSHSTTVP